jgi:sugar/nucleoside kinase (ribokinase family)
VELLARCNAAAALSTLRPGAMRAMPAAAEVEAFLATRGGGPAAS